MSKDINYSRNIQSKRWLYLRKWKLTKDPLCEDCMMHGIVTPATEVHHIIPCEETTSIEELKALMFDCSNLASLCHAHHALRHQQMHSHSKASVADRNQRTTDRFIKKFLS